MSTAKNIQAMEEDIRQKVGTLEADVSGMKRDVVNLANVVADLGKETKDGFAKIFDRMETRGSASWQIAAALLGVAVTLAVGLALWANAYFGQGISSVQRDADRALEVQAMLIQQMDSIREKHTESAVQTAILTERSERNRYEIDRLREDRHP